MASSTDNSKTHVALIGGGTIAPLHAESLLSSRSCLLTALVDPFPPPGQKLAAQLSVPYFASLQALLSSETPNPEAYIICVPSSLHIQVATDVITNGNPQAVLIETPFCTDSRSGCRLLALAGAESCQVLVGRHRRFHPSLVAARNAIDHGKLGQTPAITGTCPLDS